jgi:hypothetical protein
MQEERIKYKEREYSSDGRINVNIASKQRIMVVTKYFDFASSKNMFLLVQQRIREIRYEISGNFRRNLQGKRETLVFLLQKI